jgi:hypothetical protein
MRRLHGPYTDAQLADLYQVPWAADRNSDDHRLRIAMTIQMGSWIAEREGLTTGADLSCGDGQILRSLGLQDITLGDLAPGYPLCGPITETVRDIGVVGIYVLSETIEHVEDPAGLLAAIRPHCRHLLLTTPDDETNDCNPEHIWGWTRDEMRGMLTDAGFAPILSGGVDFRALGYLYNYQLWCCR